jgi:hypothetical protein
MWRRDLQNIALMAAGEEELGRYNGGAGKRNAEGEPDGPQASPFVREECD